MSQNTYKQSFGEVETHIVNSIPDRLQLIAQQIDRSINDPWTRAQAIQIVRPQAVGGVAGAWPDGGPSEDEQVARVFWYTKNNIGYLNEANDLYPTAKRTQQLGAEDCDGITIYVCSLLGTLGFVTGAKVISPDGSNWHIYAMAGIRPHTSPSKRIMLDPTQQGSYPGWEPGPQYQRHIYECTFDEGKALWKKVR
jgi:hypothetical protein